MSAQLYQGPVDFYVAKGPADACGPGCSEWIAAEGKFDDAAAARLRDFLNSPRHRSLPVFFHSPGGVLSQGIAIAQLLRENRMSAGVAHTIIDGCTAYRRFGGNCDKLVKSGEDVPARLELVGGQCHSACVFALAGAVTRNIAPGALIGVHSPRTDAIAWKKYSDKHPDARRLSDEERHLGLWRFVLTLGVDPAMVDLAGRVSPKALYILSRDEIDHFNLQSHDRFETGWLARDQADGKFEIVKAVTPAGGDRSTMIVQLGCVGSAGYQLTIFSPVPRDVDLPPSYGLFAAADASIAMRAGKVNDEGYWTAVAPMDALQRIASAREVRFAAIFNGGESRPRAAQMSTDGLAEVLSELQKRCAQRKVTSAAVPPAK
ncbi:MAG: hypothetical protein ACXWKC_08530 [Xanthobacteraceae bacterium]